jgi:hypothetical protein
VIKETCCPLEKKVLFLYSISISNEYDQVGSFSASVTVSGILAHPADRNSTNRPEMCRSFGGCSFKYDVRSRAVDVLAGYIFRLLLIFAAPLKNEKASEMSAKGRSRFLITSFFARNDKLND